MPCPRRPLSVLASTLAAAGLMLAAAGCSHVTPLGPDPAPASLPPARDLGSPISVQVMRPQPATPAGQCPAGSVALFGLQPNVPRAGVSTSRPVAAGPGSPVPAGTASPATPAPTAPPAGVACYRPVGTPVTITSAAVSSVTTKRNDPGLAWYEFVVAFPTADVAALTTLIRQAYAADDVLGMSVAGKLWQAPAPRTKFNALRAEQINLASRTQALQLYRLLVPPG
jgi:hypothetical protein